jgi:uroporphyrinogen-III synthase
MRPLLLLRPEPGLTASSERSTALGLEVVACPLFRIEPLPWEVPDASRYDALLLTSANAVRHGGLELAKLKTLPVHAVGAATADAARDAGFRVETVGEGSVADLLANLPAEVKLLHLAGEDHRAPEDARVERIIAYRAAVVAQPPLPDLAGIVVAVHSPRAGRRLGELATERDRTSIAAISDAAADAVGQGWESIDVAERPDDASLLALAAMLCHTSPPT